MGAVSRVELGGHRPRTGSLRSIKVKLVLGIMTLTIVITAAVGAASYFIMAEQVFENQKTMLFATAVAVARNTDHEVEELGQEVERIAGSDSVEWYSKNLQSATLWREFEDHAVNFSSLSYVNEAGEEKVKLLQGQPNYDLEDVSSLSTYLLADKHPKMLHRSSPYLSTLINVPALDFFYKHLDYFDDTVGVIRATVPLARFSSEALQQALGTDGFIVILDEKGHIVFGPDVATIGSKFDSSLHTDSRLLEGLKESKTLFGEVQLHDEPVFVSLVTALVSDWKILVVLPKGEFTAPLRQLRHNIVLISLIVVLLSSLLSYLLGRSITNPIIALTRVTSNFFGGGEQSERMEVRGSDEVGVLAKSFNEMLDRLQVTQEALAQNNAQLERTNIELDQFAYVVSHDLKAPLRAIANLSSWIEEDIDEALDEDTRKQFELLRGRVRRMEALINGVLEYSRIGRVAVEVETVDTQKLLEETVDSMPMPEGFAIDIDPDMPALPTSRVRFGQVFANLISNAVKYTDRQDGRVKISVQDAGDFYQFTVADNGPGISPHFHEKIFGIFQTLIAKDKFESTGVGLSLVKKIVEDEGGTIVVESEEGQGASFHFTWPKHPKEKLAA